MALLAKSGTPSLCSPTPGREHMYAGLIAGIAIAAGDACQIASTGLVMLSDGTANTDAARVDGFAAKAAAIGEAVTLYHDVHFHYGAGLTPGAGYFLAATAGRLDTAATTGGLTVIARAIDATRIAVRRSW